MEDRINEEAARNRAARLSALQPFRRQIDTYLETVSDRPIKYPGGGTYGFLRGWLKLFIENYVIEHGVLPTGTHQIVVKSNFSYSGGTHDFGMFNQASCSTGPPK